MAAVSMLEKGTNTDHIGRPSQKVSLLGGGNAGASAWCSRCSTLPSGTGASVPALLLPLAESWHCPPSGQ